jgi:hypothetical protein
MSYKLSRTLLCSVVLILSVILVQATIETVWSAGVVTVTATVNTTVTCTSNTSSASLGTLSSASIASTTGTGNASTSLSCNTGLGCTLTVADAGNGSNPGLATTSPAYIIGSANGSFAASSTLSAGTEGYGIQAATTTEGSGGSLTLARRYASTSYASVGGLSLSALTLASSTAQISSRSVVVSHWAAISGTTQAGVYSDTITYSCTGN